MKGFWQREPTKDVVTAKIFGHLRMKDWAE